MHTYAVRPGDSLYSVALKFGVSPDVIIKENALEGSALFVGEMLRIPVCVLYHRVFKGQDASRIAELLETDLSDIPEEELKPGDVMKITFPIENK